jgi:hypothetical protein
MRMFCEVFVVVERTAREARTFFSTADISSNPVRS